MGPSWVGGGKQSSVIHPAAAIIAAATKLAQCFQLLLSLCCPAQAAQMSIVQCTATPLFSGGRGEVSIIKTTCEFNRYTVSASTTIQHSCFKYYIQQFQNFKLYQSTLIEYLLLFMHCDFSIYMYQFSFIYYLNCV